jgi:hypothetical protein
MNDPVAAITDKDESAFETGLRYFRYSLAGSVIVKAVVPAG